VDDNGDTCHQDNRGDTPSQQGMQGQGQEEKYRTHTSHLGAQVTDCSIGTCPGAKAGFEKAIGRNTIDVPVKGYEVLGSEDSCNGNRKTENQRVPVACKGISR